jgi:hypothetical protein
MTHVTCRHGAAWNRSGQGGPQGATLSPQQIKHGSEQVAGLRANDELLSPGLSSLPLGQEGRGQGTVQKNTVPWEWCYVQAHTQQSGAPCTSHTFLPAGLKVGTVNCVYTQRN